MAEVADLWAAVGAKVNKAQFAQADAAIAGTKKKLDGLTGALAQFNGSFQDKNGRWRAANGRFLTMGEVAKLAAGGVDGAAEALKRARKSGGEAAVSLGGVGKMFAVLGAGLGLRAAGKAMIGFNASAEQAKLQIAGMLALARKTDLKDQISTADELYARLQKRAAALPGETSEYVQMAGKIARVVLTAGGSVQDLEDLTANAVVAAKGLGEQWEVAARDIEQALMGRFNTTDPFTSKVLAARGYTGEEGRERFRGLSAKKRFEEMRAALLSPQFTQLGEEFGKTFTGRLDQIKDAIKRFFGAIGKPLFEALKGLMDRASKFFDENREQIEETAAAVGEKLVAAFQVLGAVVEKVFGFLSEHGEFTKSLLITIGAILGAFAIKAAVAWAVAFAPVVAVIAVVTALVYAIRQLQKHPDKVRAAFRSMWDGIKGALGAVWGAIKAFGDRIWKFFSEDIPNAIVAAFEAAFEAVANLPVVKQILRAVRWASRFTSGGDDSLASVAGGARTTPMLSPAAAGASASVSVDVGGINVNSSNADPAAVAVEVRRVFSDELGSVFRRTMDVVG